MVKIGNELWYATEKQSFCNRQSKTRLDQRTRKPIITIIIIINIIPIAIIIMFVNNYNSKGKQSICKLYVEFYVIIAMIMVHRHRLRTGTVRTWARNNLIHANTLLHTRLHTYIRIVKIQGKHLVIWCAPCYRSRGKSIFNWEEQRWLCLSSGWKCKYWPYMTTMVKRYLEQITFFYWSFINGLARSWENETL